MSEAQTGTQVFNPYTKPDGSAAHEGWVPILKDQKYDPSSFRVEKDPNMFEGAGGYNIYSGDQHVGQFDNENSVADFTSMYSQGWQQRQDSKTDSDKWQDVIGKYGWEPPSVTTPTVQTNTMTATDDQKISTDSGQVQEAAPQVDQQQAMTSRAPVPEELQTALMEAVKSSTDMESLLNTLGPIVGSLSGNSQVEAAQAEMSRESTVQGQLEDLMKSFEGGDPPWATGPMRTANAIMAQRGLSASSMAGKAITNAVMEAALPIAQADANMSAQFQFANLSNLQQARIQNAQSFLQMDLNNFNAAQQMQMFKAQERSSSLLSDVAAENASRQFNAANENQTQQFMANMASQVQQFNAQQSNAMQQFNAGQANSISQFRSQQEAQRQQFNAQNRLIIDQANAKWRQEVTTINNATINEANRINAQNLLSVSLAEYNNISQARRDALNYAYTSSESAKDRATELVLAELREEGATERASMQEDAAKRESRNSLFASAGKFVASLF